MEIFSVSLHKYTKKKNKETIYLREEKKIISSQMIKPYQTTYCNHERKDYEHKPKPNLNWQSFKKKHLYLYSLIKYNKYFIHPLSTY